MPLFLCAADLQLVVLEAHRGAFARDALPHGPLFVVAQEHPVRYFGGRAAAALADFVEEGRAHADAGAVGQVVEIGGHREGSRG